MGRCKTVFNIKGYITAVVFIGNKDGSGARYNCKNYDDLISAIKTYCDLYVNCLEPKGEKIKNKDMER